MSLRSFARTHWPLIGALTLFLLCVAGLLAISLSLNQGHFGYVIDDPYVHMAVAKHFAQHGVWGVTPYGFSWSTSSTLWPLLIAGCYRLFGVRDVIPFALNLVFSLAVVFLAYRFLRQRRPEGNHFFVFLALLGVVFLSPLPTLVFVGMEHSLHTFLCLLAVFLTTSLLNADKPGAAAGGLTSLLLCLTLPLVVLTRYEGLFLVGVVSLLLAVRGRWRFAMLLGLLAVLPVALLGFFSVRHGFLWLPNAALMNAQTFQQGQGWKAVVRLLGASTMVNLWKSPHVLVLLSVALLLLAREFHRSPDNWQEPRVLLLIFTPVMLLHVQLASLGWFYRYEAYLVCLGLVAITRSVRDFLPRPGALRPLRRLLPALVSSAALFLVLISPLLFRAFVATVTIPQGTRNIYEQNFQMAVFLKRFYEGRVVAINDLGIANYLADLRCLDLYGIGTVEVARMKLENGGGLRAEQMREAVRIKGAKVAVLQGWMTSLNEIPAEWLRVGEWEIVDLASSADARTLFFAVDESERESLKANLRAFASELPADVIQRGEYLEGYGAATPGPPANPETAP